MQSLLFNKSRQRALWSLAIGITFMLEFASAQDGSLLTPRTVTPDGKVVGPAPLTLENSSLLYQALPPEARGELKVEDSIIVLVDYRTSMSSEGETLNRKQSNINAVLADWIAFDGRDIFAAPQSRGDPRISGSLNSQFRAEAELELRDTLTFRIAAKIVDIRPNGNLVIEAHRKVSNNHEVWMQSLTGVVARQFVNPDRTVRSDSITDLHIDKRELGQVRDGYSPGWLTRWYGKWKPF